MDMRRVLGVLLGTLLLASCGTDQPGDDVAQDQAQTADQTPTQSPTETPTDGQTDGQTVPDGPVDFALVAVVSQSLVGGAVFRKAAAVDTEEQLAAFAGQFEDDRMGQALQRAVAGSGVPDEKTLLGAVVAIGCAPPVDVHVAKSEAGLIITAEKVETKIECLVPVTSVALVAVDDAVVEAAGV